tara:strand:- start:98 stop:373 length:276 start_codon:yes stop_codon:yes gene_type:complete
MNGISSIQTKLKDSDDVLKWWGKESRKAIEEVYFFNELLETNEDEDGSIASCLEYSKQNLIYLATKGEYELRKRKECQDELSKELIQTVFE